MVKTMINESVVRFEEKAIFELRSLYNSFGYLPYKMSKFEEYELYIRNKDFLVSDRVITFNDTNGKMMALKPDVTLSIIKNGDDIKGVKQKVYYNENVYRVSESTHRFKEIMQAGLECIGDIDICDIYEVITLAAESLSKISDNFFIEISNIDIVYSVVLGVCDDAKFVETAMEYISKKNSHDLLKLCEEYSVGQKDYNKIASLISLYGKRKDVLKGISEIYSGAEMGKMEKLSAMLDKSPNADKIKFDFSVISDTKYYNGFVFKGFVDGICCDILAGGQYDKMMKKMNRTSGAIGFAIYLDKLEELNAESEKFDVDCLVLYDENTDTNELLAKINELTKSGKSINAQKNIPEKLRYKEIADIRKDKNNA